MPTQLRNFALMMTIALLFTLGIVFHQTIEIRMLRDMIVTHDTAIRINQTLMQGRPDCLGQPRTTH